jgi:hypothetical protein
MAGTLGSSMAPKKTTSSVFRGTRGIGDNVLLNFQDRSEREFGLYADAFHRAAKDLVANLGPGFSSLEALPIIYLYRHALELGMKATLNHGAKLLYVLGEPIDEAELSRIFFGHRLTPLFAAVGPILKHAGFKWNLGVPGLTNRDQVHQVVLDLERIDPESYAFRYPIGKEQKASLPPRFWFDIRKFASLMDPLSEAFIGASETLAEMHRSACAAMED